MRKYRKLTILSGVLKEVSTWAALVSATVLVVMMVILTPNFGLFKQVIVLNGWGEGARLAGSLLWPLNQSISTFNVVVAALLGALLGLNSVLLVVRSRRAQRFSKKDAATGTFGFLLGIIGVGCAACGTALISALIPFIGISSILVLLPFGGVELQLVAILVLAYTIWRLLRDLANPLVCQVEF